MPKMDLNTSITAAVAFCAIISPILTALINNRHQIKIKKMELKQKEYEQSVLHIRNIFEEFLRTINKVCQDSTSENISKYAESYSLAYIYLPKHVRIDLSKVNILVRKNLWDEVINYVDAISEGIYEELHNLNMPKQR